VDVNTKILLPKAGHDKYHSWIVLWRTKVGILSWVPRALIFFSPDFPRLLHSNYITVPEIAQDSFLQSCHETYVYEMQSVNRRKENILMIHP
jgi:hypothetical protein